MKDGANKVKHMHVMTVAHRAMLVVMVMIFLLLLVIIKRGDICPEDGPPKSCKLLCQIELAQATKVVFTDEACSAVVNHINVNVQHGEKVLSHKKSE